MAPAPSDTPSRYPIPAGEHRHELVEKRSRFLCILAPIDDEAGAAAHLAALRDEFSDANHHCWAFLVGPPGHTARMGSSDAGEPSGTAGRPMLEALVHGPVGDVAAVVVRWFGGVKLGTGGLARAYAGVVRDALVTLPTTLRTDWVDLSVCTGYAQAEVLHKLYADYEAELLGETFDAGVTHRLRVPADRFDGLLASITSATNGTAVVERS